MTKNKKKTGEITALFISNGYGLTASVSGGEIRLHSIISSAPANFKTCLLTTEGGVIESQKHLQTRKTEIIPCRSSFIAKKETYAFQRFFGYIISAITGFLKIKHRRFDMIYTSSDFFCDTLPAFFYKKKYAASKWCAMIHHLYMPPASRPGHYLFNLFMYSLQQFSFRLIAKQANMINVLDTPQGIHIIANVKKYGFSGRINMVKNGISKLINPLSFKKDRRLALYVGGLRSAKGLYDIVPVWKEIVKQGPYRLVIAGKMSSENHSYLSRELTANGLEKYVKIAGFVPPKELDSLMKKASVYFFPSREEGWGISVLEALNYGLQPVVYDLPAYNSFREKLKTANCFDVNAITKLTLEAFAASGKKNNSRFLKDFFWDEITNKEFDAIEQMLRTKKT